MGVVVQSQTGPNSKQNYELDRDQSHLYHILFFLRPQVQFPAPLSDGPQSPGTPAPEGSEASDVHAHHRHILIHNYTPYT